ncbi:MAG: hypothetical protein R3Y33_07145 [Clostridia bacterium]
MKKIFLVFMSVCLISVFTACSSETNSSTISESLESTQTEDLVTDTSVEGIDHDISSLSATMAYAEVYTIMSSPNDYVGETFKVCGEFGIYQDPSTEQLYYAVIISDATNCCVQGFEFILTDETAYPEVGEEATVIGEFQTYLENDVLYCHLVDAYLI